MTQQPRHARPADALTDVNEKPESGAASTKPTISAVVVSCDDAEVIAPCLESIAGWVDEIVVVDMHSTDGTREIVRRYTDQLIDHERLTYADPMRNVAMALAKGTWTLMLDPDERVPEPLARELQRIVREDAVDVVMLPYRQMMFGRVLQSPGGADMPHPRLFRTGAYVYPPEVHGQPDLSGKRILHLSDRGPDYAIHHNTWRSVAQVVDKLMRYTPHDAENLQAQGVSFSPRQMWRVLGDEFMGRAVAGRAYEDGMPGLLMALYFTFYKMSIWATLWENQGRSDAFDRAIRRRGRRLRRPLWFAYRVVRKLFLSRGKPE